MARKGEVFEEVKKFKVQRKYRDCKKTFTSTTMNQYYCEKCAHRRKIPRVGSEKSD